MRIPGELTSTHRTRTALIAACSLLLACAALAAGLRAGHAGAAPGDPPNVVLITTDDQTLEEMRGLPQTTSLIGGAGVTFTRNYASYPLCCPSRATALTGQYMHNNGVRGNSKPFGGWARFNELGTEAKALPTWLDSAGYYNVEIGKYMNGYGGDPPPVPPGWDEWYGKLSEYDSTVPGYRIYFNYRLREDPPVVGGVPCPDAAPPAPGEPFTCLYGQDTDDYQTDVIREKATEAIDRLSGPVAPETPFFLKVDFNAPHDPYVPAPRHAGTQAGTPVPAPAASNEEDISDKPRFLRRLPRLGNGKLNQIVNRRRARLEMLASVDEAVADIVGTLESEGELANTYVIFTSDNGYFSGEHRIRQGKYLPHEPSSHMPLMIRGPGITAGTSSGELVSNVDLAPTIAGIAEASPTLTMDGRSLLPYATNAAARSTRGLLLEGDSGAGIDDDGIEDIGSSDADEARLKAYYKKRKAQIRKLKKRCAKLKRKSPKRAIRCFNDGVGNLEQEPTDSTYKLQAPAYSSLRTDRYFLNLYSTGEIELYDMRSDPDQLHSLDEEPRFKAVRKWMLAKLNQLAACTGDACTAQLGAEPKPAKKKRPKPKKKKPKKQPQS